MTPTSGSCPSYAPLLSLEPDAVRCPYPIYEELRRDAPVEWIDELGAYAVTRYDDVVEVIHHPELFSSAMPTGPKATAAAMELLQTLLTESSALHAVVAKSFTINATPVLLNADPPAHDRQRALVNRAFSPRRVAQMEEHIREVADRLIDQFIDRGSVEFVTEFAVGLPLTVIATALGVPDGDLPTFKRWSDDFVALIGNHHLTQERLSALITTQGEFVDYFTDKIEQRTAHPQDDLISDVVLSRIDGEALSTAEMLGMFSQFLVAGNETTTKLLASAMLLLLRRPELEAELRADPSRIAAMIEEALRLEAPVQGLFRMAVAATELGGVAIPAGSHLWVLYGSANRDEDEFPKAAEVDLDRSNARSHLAFGHGVHYCLGANLSRAEGRIGFEALLERLDDLNLSPDNEYVYESSYALHGLKELHLTFQAKQP